jgi:diacylglycerol kinase (ATP)
MRAFIVLNPVAGPDDGTEVRAVIEAHFSEAGWEAEVHETSKSENVTERTRSALEAGYEVVVAAGGDGTVAAVGAALVGTDCVMGVLPTGSGNGLARELGIPLALPQALALLTGSHDQREIDAIEVPGHGYFFLNLSMGMTARAMRDTSRQEKRRFGWLAYLWRGGRALIGIQPVSFHLTVDGQTERVRATDVLIANLGSMGVPVLRLAPEVASEPGELDIMTIRARTLWDTVRIAWAMVTRRQRQTPHLRFLRARERVTIDATPQQPVQADGEFLGMGPVEVRVAPAAVRIMVPVED